MHCSQGTSMRVVVFATAGLCYANISMFKLCKGYYLPLFFFLWTLHPTPLPRPPFSSSPLPSLLCSVSSLPHTLALPHRSFASSDSPLPFVPTPPQQVVCYDCIYVHMIYLFFFFTFMLGTTCYESMFFYFYYSSCITRILHASDAWLSYMLFPLYWTHVEHVSTMCYAHVFTYIKCS